MEDEESGEELELAAALGARARFGVRRSLLVNLEGRVHKRLGGSRRERRPNHRRDFDLRAYAILRDFFGVDGKPPVYGEDAFEESFVMPRPVFKQLFRTIYDQPYWRRPVNATDRPHSHAIQKVAAAKRTLAYGEPFDRSDEYCRLSRSTIGEASQRLTEFIIHKWEPYLRPSTDEALEDMLTLNAAQEMPGCIGSIACTHWQRAKWLQALGR